MNNATEILIIENITKTAKLVTQLTDRIIALEGQVQKLQGKPKVQADMHGES